MSKPYLTNVTIELNEPVVCLAAGGKPISSVVLRRPKAKHLKAIESLGRHATAAKLINMLSEPSLSESEIDELDANDIRKMDVAFAVFMQSSRATGEPAKSS